MPTVHGSHHSDLDLEQSFASYEDAEDHNTLFAADLPHGDQVMADIPVDLDLCIGSVPTLGYHSLIEHFRCGSGHSDDPSFGIHSRSESSDIWDQECEQIAWPWLDDRLNFGLPSVNDPPPTLPYESGHTWFPGIIDGQATLLTRQRPASRNGQTITTQPPAELLPRIFSLCMINDCDTLLLSNGPWLFTYICSSWRTLVLNTPELWTSIRYYDDWEGGAGITSLLASAKSNADLLKKSRSRVGAGHLASLALNRSGALPLSFQFQTDRKSVV